MSEKTESFDYIGMCVSRCANCRGCMNARDSLINTATGEPCCYIRNNSEVSDRLGWDTWIKITEINEPGIEIPEDPKPVEAYPYTCQRCGIEQVAISSRAHCKYCPTCRREVYLEQSKASEQRKRDAKRRSREALKQNPVKRYAV